jgi:hypothetical protein
VPLSIVGRRLVFDNHITIRYWICYAPSADFEKSAESEKNLAIFEICRVKPAMHDPSAEFKNLQSFDY